MKLKKKVILIAGPTASGKSKLAIKLANFINSEIINADSMQVYKEISILTSKPNFKDLKIAKHHLYGFVSVKKKFSAGSWLKMTIKKIEKHSFIGFFKNERFKLFFRCGEHVPITMPIIDIRFIQGIRI